MLQRWRRFWCRPAWWRGLLLLGGASHALAMILLCPTPKSPPDACSQQAGCMARVICGAYWFAIGPGCCLNRPLLQSSALLVPVMIQLCPNPEPRPCLQRSSKLHDDDQHPWCMLFEEKNSYVPEQAVCCPVVPKPGVSPRCLQRASRLHE